MAISNGACCASPDCRCKFREPDDHYFFCDYMKDDPKPHGQTRWGLRFSLRGLLITVTIICIVLGWRLNRAAKQRQAVEAIRAAGGWVYYDYQRYDPHKNKFDVEAQTWVPLWLLDPVGVDFWHEVDAVNMSYQEAKGQRWDNEQPPTDIAPHLANLQQLRYLGLTKHAVEDAGMRHVGKLKQLEVLQYWDAPGISDDGMVQFRDMPRLRYLGMSSSEIGDRGLAALAKLEGLEGLTLQANNITDAGLAALAGHSHLKRLWVGGLRDRPSRITNAGVIHLAKIPGLEELDLQHTQVTVEGLEPLQKLPALKSLYLSGSQADDYEAVSAMFTNCQISAKRNSPLGQ